MKVSFFLTRGILLVIAVSLFKIAFLSSENQNLSIIPPAHASGGIMEWHNAKKIVTSGKDGSVTYVWDYEGQTKVRKYSVHMGRLLLENYKLEKD